MIEEEIKYLREKLNNSIENNESYKKIYEYSVELDELIANYYLKEQKVLCK